MPAHRDEEFQQPVIATFPDTRWSVVLRAGVETGGAGKVALEQLCRDYWFPLYAFVWRRGHSPEDAQDVTQGFMLHLIERSWAVALLERVFARLRAEV
jgi:RNA polymerase sigma-70 factor (ECF subfamily)